MKGGAPRTLGDFRRTLGGRPELWAILAHRCGPNVRLWRNKISALRAPDTTGGLSRSRPSTSISVPVEALSCELGLRACASQLNYSTTQEKEYCP